jgi:hypothetical protein
VTIRHPERSDFFVYYDIESSFHYERCAFFVVVFVFAF